MLSAIYEEPARARNFIGALSESLNLNANSSKIRSVHDALCTSAQIAKSKDRRFGIGVFV